MNLQHNPNLGGLLKDSYLVIDTSVLIDASKEDDFYKMIQDISAQGCTLISINAVKYEFLRGASNFNTYNEYEQYLEDLRVIFLSNFEQAYFSDPDSKTFLVALNNIKKGRKKKLPSYTDSMLLYLLYKYRNSKDFPIKLMTSNYEDVPLDFFDREQLIVFEESKEVRTEAIYSFNNDRFNKYVSGIKNKFPH